MSMTKTGILGTTIFFYAIVTYLVSLYGSSIAYTTDGISKSFGFLGNAIIGFSSLGWLNAILFTPLIAIVIWIVASSLIPTTNAGA